MDRPDAANPFGDLTKMLEQFKLPGFDVPAIMEARRKDMEALVQANQTAFQGMQSLAQKQADMLRSTLSELQSLTGQLSASRTQASFASITLLKESPRKFCSWADNRVTGASSSTRKFTLSRLCWDWLRIAFWSDHSCEVRFTST